MSKFTWRKSTFSNGSAGCVEVKLATEEETTDYGYAPGDRIFFVRDTKNRDREPHHFTQKEWEAFLAGAKAGEFDVEKLVSEASEPVLEAQSV